MPKTIQETPLGLPEFARQAVERWQNKGMYLPPIPTLDFERAIGEGRLNISPGDPNIAGEITGPSQVEYLTPLAGGTPGTPSPEQGPPRWDIPPDIADKVSAAWVAGQPIFVQDAEGKMIPLQEAPSGQYGGRGYMAGPEGIDLLGGAPPAAMPTMVPYYPPGGGAPGQISEQGQQALLQKPKRTQMPYRTRDMGALRQALGSMKPIEIIGAIETKMGQRGTDPEARKQYRQMLIPFLLAGDMPADAVIAYAEQGLQGGELAKYLSHAESRKLSRELGELRAAGTKTEPLPPVPKGGELTKEVEKAIAVYEGDTDVEGVFFITPSGAVIPEPVNYRSLRLGAKNRRLIEMWKEIENIRAGNEPEGPYVVERLGGARAYRPKATSKAGAPGAFLREGIGKALE